MFMSLELRKTFAFEYPLSRMNPLHICLVSSAVLLDIIFILLIVEAVSVFVSFLGIHLIVSVHLFKEELMLN